MKTKPELNSFVVFDFCALPERFHSEDDYERDEDYELYYKHFEDKTYIFLGEIVQAPGHCILLDIDTGKVEAMHHTDNFRQLTEDEV